MQTVRGNTHVPDNTKRKMRASFIRLFVLSFIQKHGKWPDISFDPDDHSVIATLYRNKVVNVDEHSPGYDWEDWALATLGKNFEFDYFVDYTELVEDRSISEVFCKDILNLPRKHRQAPETRRLLINLDDFQPVEIVNRIASDSYPKSWNVVGVHSKERELKVSPRLFAMHVPEVRYYLCATEKNLAKKIFPYFHQQTMTATEDELLKRLLALSKQSEVIGECIKEHIFLDWKSWNLTWTKESTDPVFQCLDDVFGIPGLYTMTHVFFQRALCYLSSHYFPPPELEEGYFPESQDGHLWYNHSGGFEGARQKGWTLGSIVALEMMILDWSLNGEITGQGDNQILTCYLPPIDPGLTPKENLAVRTEV